MTELVFTTSFDESNPSDALIVPFFDIDGSAKSACEVVSFQEALNAITDLGDFQAKSEEILSTYFFEKSQKRLILMGLGEKEKLTPEIYRRAFSKAFCELFKTKASTVTVFLPQKSPLEDLFVNKLAIETYYLINYQFKGYKNLKEQEKNLEKITFISSKEIDSKDISNNFHLVEGVNLTRDLVIQNADDINPEMLQKLAKQLGSEFDHLDVKILDKKDLEKEQMGLFLSVARGSMHEPYLAVMQYKNAPESDLNPVIVGKGITYDTGGLSLKPTSGMVEMKCDMGGSAVVFGLIKAIAALKLPVNVTGVCALSENSIDSKSYKIGDVYTGKGNISVEIMNTDAEGRLALADSISYALEHLSPSHIIDIATLTGACEVALGSERAALFSTSDQLAEAIYKAGEDTSEKVWRMPLDDDYKDLLKSQIADIKNLGNRAGSLIASAIFLKTFVKKDIPWAHLDIAGTTLLSAPRRYHRSASTGYGVRLLVHTLKRLFNIA